jgi:lipoprotein NlpI
MILHPVDLQRTNALKSVISAVLFLAAVTALGVPRQAEYDAALASAATLLNMGDAPGAEKLLTGLIRRQPKSAAAYLYRAEARRRQHLYKAAAADLASAVALQPQHADYWQQRGEAEFRAGMIEASIKSFDAFLKMKPEQKPHHWQRGISLYYAGRYKEGKSQFELHQTVNPQDVENAVWHFLCVARSEGLQSARRQLISISQDPRVPMAQVHRLFAGEGREEDVLKAAQDAEGRAQGGEPVFYANLYLALYSEALGNSRRAAEFITKAAARAEKNGYMGDVARVHAQLRGKRQGLK